MFFFISFTSCALFSTRSKRIMVSCMICLVSSTRESSFWKVVFLFWSIFVENDWKKWCDWWIYREKYIKDVVMVSFLLVITTANRVSFSPVKKVLTYPPMDRVADWVQPILIFFLWRGCFRRFLSIYEEGERIEEPIKKKRLEKHLERREWWKRKVKIPRRSRSKWRRDQKNAIQRPKKDFFE